MWEIGKWEYISPFEVGMSRVIMEAGYAMDSLMQVENNGHKLPHGDIHYEAKYFSMTPNPLEIMFIKTNRINDIYVQNYTKWNQGS